jgi:hypothetical protein
LRNRLGVWGEVILGVFRRVGSKPRLRGLSLDVSGGGKCPVAVRAG